MVFPVGAAIGLLSTAAGGIIGGNEAKKAEAEQRRLIAEARGLYGDARGALDEAQDLTLSDIDAANAILAGIEPAVLEGLDEELRIRVASQVMREQQAQAELSQRQASAGLDATTVGSAQQRSQRYGQAQQMGQLAAGFAGQRSNAIMQSRQLQSQGLFNRAQTLASFGSQRAGLFSQEAGFVGGIQVQAPNTGAAIGAIGGQLGNLYSEYQQGKQDSAYQSELLALLGKKKEEGSTYL